MVYLDFANFVENLNKLPEDIDFVVRNIAESGNRVSEIIDLCGGDRKLTAAYLKQLYELAVLSIENGQSSYEFPPVPDWMPSKKREEKVEITVETSEIVEEKENLADTGKKEETEKPEPEPVSAPVTESAGKPKKSAWDDFDAQAARRGKSGKITLFVLLLAIAAAIIIFIYCWGLI